MDNAIIPCALLPGNKKVFNLLGIRTTFRTSTLKTVTLEPVGRALTAPRFTNENSSIGSIPVTQVEGTVVVPYDNVPWVHGDYLIVPQQVAVTLTYTGVLHAFKADVKILSVDYATDVDGTYGRLFEWTFDEEAEDLLAFLDSDLHTQE